MARIIEGKRRIIQMSADDIISVVKQYQQLTHNISHYEKIRELLTKADFYIPEEM